MTAERAWQGITIERALASTGLYIPTTNSKTENSTTIVVGSNMTDSEVPVFENFQCATFELFSCDHEWVVRSTYIVQDIMLRVP